MKTLEQVLESIPEALAELRNGIKCLIDERNDPDMPDKFKSNLQAFAKSNYGIDIFNMAQEEMNLLDQRMAHFLG